MILGNHFTVANHAGSIIKPRRVLARVAENDMDTGNRTTDMIKRLLHPLHQFGAQQQIFRRVAGQAQFRKHNRIGPLFVAGAAGNIDNAVGVTGDIADQQIHLG